jgi:hypothetical protein
MHAGCTCTAPVMLRAGAVVCATCGAPVVGEAPAEVYTTLRLPPDCKTADRFTRACRSGRVVGAVKRGRDWSCSAEAWEARGPAGTPPGLTPKRKPLAKTKGPELPTVSEDLLRELGAVGRFA